VGLARERRQGDPDREHVLDLHDDIEKVVVL
jgi:hypothetical protein